MGAKNFGVDGKGQFSYFACRLYADSKDDVFRMINLLPVRHYAFILHDMDIFLDNDENHQIGDRKKPHYHLLLNMVEKTTWKKIKTLIEGVLPSCGVQIRDVKNTEAAALYLTHNTREALQAHKHLYDVADIVSDDYRYWLSDAVKAANKEEKQNILNVYIDMVIENNYRVTNQIINHCRKIGGGYFIVNKIRADKILQQLMMAEHGVLVNDMLAVSDARENS